MTSNENGKTEQSNFILNAMFNAMTDAVFCKGLDRRYIECNASFEEFIAHPKEEIIGKTFEELTGEVVDIVKNYVDVDATVLYEGKTVVQEDVSLTYNGSVRFYDLIKTPLIRKNAEGEDEIFGLVCIMHDVNERYMLIKDLKHMQSNLEIALERANSGSRAKSEFLSRMSHELLTPMNAIMGMAQVIKASSDIDYIKDCNNDIYENSSHLLRLISNLLEVSSGTASLTDSLFKIDILIENVKNRIKTHLENKQQTLEVLTGELALNEINADIKRIEKVIYHLLTNASKFSHENSKIVLSVDLPEESAGRFILKVSVADEGIGITKEILNTIFDIFEQGDGSYTRKYRGVGIGLTLSKYIIETMGGTLTVKSEPKKGSTFTFTIPVR